MKAKMFKSNGGFEPLESAINDWFKHNPKVKVVSVGYSDNQTYCSAIIIYKT